MEYLLEGGVNFESGWPNKTALCSIFVDSFKHLRWPIFKVNKDKYLQWSGHRF